MIKGCLITLLVWLKRSNKNMHKFFLMSIIFGGYSCFAASSATQTRCLAADLEKLSSINGLDGFTLKDSAGVAHIYYKSIDDCWATADLAKNRAISNSPKDTKGLPRTVTCAKVATGPCEGWFEQLVDVYST